jgi:MFS family permease
LRCARVHAGPSRLKEEFALHGALVIGVLFASTALSVGASQYAFGLFIEPLEQQFAWTRTEISASLSFAAVTGLASPFIGRAMDRYGVRPILVLSLVIGGIAFGLRPFMTELWHWYALSFLQFIAFAGTTVLPTGKLVANWYPHARGRVMGITATGNNFGGLVIPPAIVAVLAVATWREGYLALAAISFAIAALAYFVVHERPLHGRLDSSFNEPTDRRLTKDASHASRTPHATDVITPKRALRTRAFYSVLIAFMLGSFTYSIILPHVFAHLMTAGINRQAASFALGTFAIGGIFGKLIFGYLAERAGARKATIANLCGQSAFACLLALADTTQALVLLTPLFGVFLGGFGLLMPLLVQETFGLRYFGSIMGLANSGVVVSWGLGPLIAGLSYDITGAYDTSFLLAATCFLVGACVLLLSPLPNVLATSQPSH